jgi:hypothetical protein
MRSVFVRFEEKSRFFEKNYFTVSRWDGAWNRGERREKQGRGEKQNYEIFWREMQISQGISQKVNRIYRGGRPQLWKNLFQKTWKESILHKFDYRGDA